MATSVTTVLSPIPAGALTAEMTLRTLQGFGVVADMSISCQTTCGNIWHELDGWSISCQCSGTGVRHESDMALYVDRDDEMEQLLHLRRKRVASLVVCKGRRRIGKSTFIRRPLSGHSG